MKIHVTLISLIVCGVAVAAGELSTFGDVPSLGSVVFFPEGNEDVSAGSTVCIVQNGIIVAKRHTSFKEPILFDSIPQGAATLIVVPHIGYPTHVSGSMEITIDADERVSVRFPIVPRSSVPLTLTVIDVDGTPLVNQAVYLNDVNNKESIPKKLLYTNKKGVIVVPIVANREYQASLRKGRFEQVFYVSNIFKADEKGSSIVWQLRKPPVIVLNFVIKNGDETEPLVGLKSIRISTEKTGITASVHDGAVEVTKHGMAVQGAKRIYVELVTIEGREHLRIKEPWIEVDDTEVQEVSVIVERTDTKE